MTQDVWISSVGSNHQLFDKQGIREKLYGQDWAPPTFNLDAPGHEYLQILRQYEKAEKLDRSHLPEAAYVFDEKRWAKRKDLFAVRAIYAVKGKLTEILKQFDLGGTDLVEFPIYQADKTTQLPGPFYFLNLGSRKDSFLIEKTKGARLLGRHAQTGKEVWSGPMVPKDGDVAVSSSALQGADLWVEPKYTGKIFMSGPLHDAIEAAHLKIDFYFTRARIVDD